MVISPNESFSVLTLASCACAVLLPTKVSSYLQDSQRCRHVSHSTASNRLADAGHNEPKHAELATIVDCPSEVRRLISCRLGLERLLRKLLKMPGQPAVLYYHYWPPAWGQYSAHYWSGIEDVHEVCRHHHCN